LALFRSNQLQPFAQYLDRLRDTSESVPSSVRVSSVRQMSRYLDCSWRHLHRVVATTRSRPVSSRAGSHSVERETAQQVQALLATAHALQEQWACIYHMDMEAEAAAGAGSGRGGAWVAEHELLFCDTKHLAAVDALAGLRFFRDTTMAAAAKKAMAPEATAFELNNAFEIPPPPPPDNQNHEYSRNDSVRLARLAAFRHAQPHLSSKYSLPPPPSDADEGPYQLPWYYVDARCRVQRLDHAAEGQRRHCPPPPYVSSHGQDAHQRHATVVTVPHALGMPRVDVAGHDRAASFAVEREAQRLARLPPADRVRAVKALAQERRRGGERKMHVNLAAFVAHGRARPDHLKGRAAAAAGRCVVPQRDKMVHRVGHPLASSGSSVATLEARVQSQAPREELAANQPAYPPNSLALEKQLFRAPALPVF
jgi:hypothetical protein